MVKDLSDGGVIFAVSEDEATGRMIEGLGLELMHGAELVEVDGQKFPG